MIIGSTLYAVVKAMVPLYSALILGFVSVRYLHAFSPDQSKGINHFVAVIAAPLLIFRMTASNNPYAMSARLVASDTLQKIILLVVLFAWAAWANCGSKKTLKPSSSLQWAVTIFSLASMPNIIIMGVPLLGGMYGPTSAPLMVQIVVLQFCVWYNVVIFFYEYMSAKRAIVAKGHQVLPEIVLAEEQVGIVENTIADQKDGSFEMTVREEGVTGEIIEENVKSQVTIQVPPDQSVPDVPMKKVVALAMKKFLRIPNIYACFFGLLWSLIAFKIGIKMPAIIADSVAIIATTTIGLSMFSVGIFLGRQTQFIPCGYPKASISVAIRFVVGPVLMAFTSFVCGLRGTLLHIAIVQAALPLSGASFIYAEEYKVHADIMSTGIIIGNFISLPFTILYYILTGL